MSKKKVLYIVLSALVIIATVTGVSIYLFLSNDNQVTEDTVQDTTEIPEPVETQIPLEEIDPWYQHKTIQDAKDKALRFKDYQLVLEEEIPIDVVAPTYNPDDWHSESYQTRFTEEDSILQMFEKTVVAFMSENRNIEVSDFQSSIYDGVSYYSYSAILREYPDYNHLIEWYFMMGEFDDTTEDCYTFLVFRLDEYK